MAPTRRWLVSEIRDHLPGNRSKRPRTAVNTYKPVYVAVHDHDHDT